MVKLIELNSPKSVPLEQMLERYRTTLSNLPSGSIDKASYAALAEAREALEGEKEAAKSQLRLSTAEKPNGGKGAPGTGGGLVLIPHADGTKTLQVPLESVIRITIDIPT